MRGRGGRRWQGEGEAREWHRLLELVLLLSPNAGGEREEGKTATGEGRGTVAKERSAREKSAGEGRGRGTGVEGGKGGASTEGEEERGRRGTCVTWWQVEVVGGKKDA